MPGKRLAALLSALLLGTLRLSLLPLYTDFSRAFSHDSAYIAIVARNLLQGKGWVNDASWLVFLHPARLPMPYRNANPLYPLLTAVAAKLFAIPVVRSGLLVAGLSSAGLLLATFFLVSHYVKRTGIALAVAVAVTLFPPLWENSLRMLPDSLHLALLVAGMAFFVRAERLIFAATAGVLLGAAWLTRSTAALAALALVVYAFSVWGSRKAVVRLGLAALVAAVLASPWLIYSAHVWGSPLGNDGAYSVFQDFYARSYNDSSDRFWHSPNPPPSPTELLRREGGAVVLHTVTGIPKVLRVWLRQSWERHYAPRLIFVALLVVLALVFRHRFREPPLIASVVFAVTQIVAFAIRADTVEPRYLAPLTAFAAMWLACGVADLMGRCATKPVRCALIFGIAVCAVYVPLRDLGLVKQLAAEDAQTSSWRRGRRMLSATITHQDPVIVADAYLYSYDTGAQALSIPTSDDAYLMRYMSEYHSRWIMLTRDELRFWKPQWSSQLPSWLRVRAEADDGTLFERIDAPQAMPY